MLVGPNERMCIGRSVGELATFSHPLEFDLVSYAVLGETCGRVIGLTRGSCAGLDQSSENLEREKRSASLMRVTGRTAPDHRMIIDFKGRRRGGSERLPRVRCIKPLAGAKRGMTAASSWLRIMVQMVLHACRDGIPSQHRPARPTKEHQIAYNRYIRIHGADLGARSAIQSGSDHDRSISKSNNGIK